MSYTICSRFKGEHIVYAGYTICTSREHIVYGAFCGSTMLQEEHSEKRLTFIKLPFVIKIFVLSIFEWPFYTGFTVQEMTRKNYTT